MTDSPVIAPCTRPTMYFIGVSTTQSSIMKIFPRWAEILGLQAVITGYDAPLHAPASVYEAIVRHIRTDPLAVGALVTTHKIDLLAATRQWFDYLDPYARLCAEISCISKRDSQLRGHAKDPISSGLTWQSFVPSRHWQETGGHVLCLGAGGSATAISVFVASLPNTADRPSRFITVDRSPERLEALKAIHQQLPTDIAWDYILNEDPVHNDNLMAALPAGSLVINATGMGKDRPGSPVSDHAIWPENGLVWELNYRGELDFMQQARQQAARRGLSIMDGWLYFLHGWTQVIAEVFDVQLTPMLFAQLDDAASQLRPR